MQMKNNTWIITRKSDGQVIGEFYNYSNVLKFNVEKVIIETAFEYLVRINKSIREVK